MIKKNVVFLAIGDKQCGDSIAIRLWDTENPDNQKIIVVDGGYTNDWEQVVALVRDRFKAQKIDLVVSTHLDKDHIGGLVGVVEHIPVDSLWMHLPWDHSDEFLAARQDEFDTINITKKLKLSLQNSNDLLLAAEAAGITPEEPFAGKQYVTDFGTLTVLGPTRAYYEELVPQILDKSVSKASASNVAATTGLYSEIAKIIGQAKEAGQKILEDHHIETLSDKGDTTPSNNSSTVLLLELLDGSKLLFTGDAGKQALENAYLEYERHGHTTGELSFVQVPHHGSRRNVGPSILNKFLGERTNDKDHRRGTAYVSAVESCEVHGHPKKVATNAFTRRGYPVFHTAGQALKHGHDLDGFNGDVSPLPLFTEVEAND